MRQYDAKSLGLDIEEIDKRLAFNWSFPSHTYHDPDIFKFELDAIFSNRWQFLAPLAKLQKPGDVVTGRAGTTPIVVTRGIDGALHGFVNMCRHRGYKVVGESGHCDRLICGYHGWTYDLNGRLTYARSTENDPHFHHDELSLLPVSVDMFAQAVFVNPDPDAKRLHETHPQLESLAADSGHDLSPDSYELRREIVTDIDANWKLWYDNGLECYHCRLVHAQTFGSALNIDEESYQYRTVGELSSSYTRSGGTQDGAALTTQSYFPVQIFPGCQMVWTDNMMYMAGMVPTGPESCQFTAHYLARPDADAAVVEEWIAMFDQTFDEDKAVCEVQQEGLRTDRLTHMRYTPEREAPVIYFVRLIWDAYKRRLATK